ncbi:thiosulfate transmembrane transporter [Aureococcus anophagefferens]|nr:thiosulfate transmembrane transporter [Aureococcus anophagefferens]
MAALAASSLPKSASHDDLAALSISKSASDGAMASPGLARAQSFASTPSLASLAGPPAPPLELEERDAASGLKYVRCMLGASAAAARNRRSSSAPRLRHERGRLARRARGPARGALRRRPAARGRRRGPAGPRPEPAPVAPAAAAPARGGGGGGAWRGVARALLDVLGEVAGDRPVLGVGHSFGAVCLLRAVDARRQRGSRFEPIVAAAGHDAAAVAGDAHSATTRGGLAIATDRGHALPMEDPPWTAAVVLAAADALLPRP